MDGRDASRMAGAPSLEQIERFGATHLADDDAVRPQPQGRAHQLGHGHDTGTGAQRHVVLCRALQLHRVFEHDHAVAGGGDLVEQGIGQRGLAGAGATRDQDVLAFAHGTAQEGRLSLGQDAVGHVGVEPDQADRALAQREDRPRRHGR